MTAATTGSNLPVNDRDAEFARQQAAYNLEPRRDALLASAAKLNKEITDEDAAALLTDAGKQLRDSIAAWDGYREVEKKPFLERSRGVDAYFHGCIRPLEEALKPLRVRLAAWNQRKEEIERARREEAERVAREEAERLSASMTDEAALAAAIAAEEAAKEAAALKAEAVKVETRGNYGGLATARKAYRCTGYDRDKLDLDTLRRYLDDAALEKAIRGFIRDGGRVLRGAKIEEVVETAFR